MTRTFQAYTSIVNVKDYGAVGTNSSDDTSAVQAAINAALAISPSGSTGSGTMIWFPPGTYLVDDLTIADVSITLVMQGAGVNSTTIKYVGNGTAIGVADLFGGSFSDFKLKTATGLIGFEFAGSTSGSHNSQLTFKNVQVEGFSTAGILSGSANLSCGSEMLFLNCVFTQNQIGVHINNGNALCFTFVQCAFSESAFGITADQGNVINVFGASCANNDVDVLIDGVGGPTILSGIRSEGSAGGIIFAGGNGGLLEMSGCQIQGDGLSLSSDPIVTLSGKYRAVLNANFFGGRVNVSGTSSFIAMSGCGVFDSQAIRETGGSVNTTIVGCYAAISTTSADWVSDFANEYESLHSFDALAASTIATSSYAVASLPSAVTSGAGARALANNATVTTFATIVAGGGANVVPVYSDGTNWRIG